MFTRPGLTMLIVLGALVGAPAVAITVRVDNPYGSITARVVGGTEARMVRTSPTRAVRNSDTSIRRQDDLYIVQVHPADGARINMEILLPFGYEFQARTVKGAISVEGFIRRAELITDTGALRLAVPWEATRLSISSQVAPKEYSEPAGISFRQRSAKLEDAELRWYLEDKLPDLKVTYGRILVQAGAPEKLVIEDVPIPANSTVKMPWQATRILNEIILSQKQTRRSRKAKPKPRRPRPKPNESEMKAITVEGGIPRFRSDVRMVTLTAAVFDRQGHPLTDLKKEDFEVIEDGVPQEVTFAGSEEVPFNLALLLDLSGSTRQDRPAMKEAAKRFIDIARPQDRVATYTLANNMFQVVSRLTNNREELKRTIEQIPRISGGSPLYDMIVLSYAEEFRGLPEARNALIVISDGVDNQIQGTGAASKVSFKKLRQAVQGLEMVIYPIFLDPFTAVPAPSWANKAKANMQALADATGGRLFVARSIHDLDPVYPQVAEELRSVYTLAYYPDNQDFNGAWRQVEVKVKRAGARVRTRMGYYGQ